jgi:DNA-binding transcriptional MocR family regulator
VFISSLWRQRIDDETLAGNLTIAEHAALLATYSLVSNGNPQPSRAQIMRRSGRSLSTVKRALRQAAHLGILESRPQHRTDSRPRGQTANRYTLHCQGRAIVGRRLRRRRQGGPTGTPNKNLTVSSTESVPARPANWQAEQAKRLDNTRNQAPPAGNDLLLARQRVIEARLRGGEGWRHSTIRSRF